MSVVGASATHESWAVRYRPRRFAGIVGQPLAVRVLTRCLMQTRVFQTVVLQGPTGSGKTSLARIYAAALHCTDPTAIAATGEPCGGCAACQAVFQHQALDFIEVDGASTRGIDTIRQLRDVAALVPTAQYRVILIDEAHRLTADAWEALLAVLEEPPPRVVFLFATTDVADIPETILSRALVLGLRAVLPADIAARLALVWQGEGLGPLPDPEVLAAIAHAARGSLREGVKLLEALTIADAVTLDGVQALAGTLSPALAAFLLHGWAHGSREDLLPFAEQLARGGESRVYLEGVAEAILAAVVVGHGGDATPTYGAVGAAQLAAVFLEVGEPVLWRWHALVLEELARGPLLPATHRLVALVAQALLARETTVTPPAVVRLETKPTPPPVANSVKPEPALPPPVVAAPVAVPEDHDVFREFGCE